MVLVTSSVYFLMGWSVGGFYCIHYYTIPIPSTFLSFFSSPRRGNDRRHLIPLHHILQVLIIPYTRYTRVYSAMRSHCYWIIISFFFRSRDSKSWKIRISHLTNNFLVSLQLLRKITQLFQTHPVWQLISLVSLCAPRRLLGLLKETVDFGEEP